MLKFFLCCLFCISSLYANLVKNDEDYFYVENNSSQILFPMSYKKETLEYMKYSKAIFDEYSEFFGKPIEGKMFNTIASSKNQIANGFVAISPHFSSTYYSGGSYVVGDFASSSWMQLLAFHEIAHLYQMNQKDDVSQNLHKTFGNSVFPLFVPIIPVPFFIYTNHLLPTLLIEGNAVFNESRFERGGRLYSAKVRAMFHALVSEDKLNYTNLLNNTLTFPYKRQKYIVGAYFFAYLSAKYGTKKANGFFVHHPSHYINPLLLNKSFKEHFGISFKEELVLFLQESKTKSIGFTRFGGKELSKSYVFAGLSSNKEGVFYLNHDGQQKMYYFAKDAKKHYSVESSMPFGKVFWLESGEFVSRAQQQVRLDKIATSLFDEAGKQKKAFEDFALLDMKQDLRAQVDINSSFIQPRLFLNNSFYTTIASNALLDDAKNVYYFKQEKDERVLYKNKKELLRFKGYDSSLADILKDEVYFIAPSKLGSTLYKFDGKELFRMSRADNIIDAKLLDEKRVIVASIEGDAYKIKEGVMVALKEEIPFYSYAFESKSIEFKAVEEKELTLKPYSEVSNLSYSNLYPSYRRVDDENIILLNALFTDPLQQNKVELFYGNDDEEEVTSLTYTNEKNRLSYAFGLAYYDNKDFQKNYKHDNYLFSLEYLLAQDERESYSLNSVTSTDEDQDGLSIQESFFSYEYFYGGLLGFYPTKASEATLFHQLENRSSIFGFQGSYFKHLGSENYVQVRGKFANSDKQNIELSDTDLLEKEVADFTIVSNSLELNTDSAYQAGLSYYKVANISWYANVFPLSLRRLSVKLHSDYFSYNNYNANKTIDKNFTETGITLDFEFLVVHIAPVNARLDFTYNDALEENIVTFKVGYEF